MRSRTVRLVAALTMAAFGGAVGVGVTHADDTVPPLGAAVVPVAVSNSVFTLPLLGTMLDVEVTTGPGGALTDIAITDSVSGLAPDGFTAAKVSSHRVAFVNEDGTAKVVVKNKRGGQSVEAKAGSLADISGTGGWVGEVFDTTPDTLTTVAFTVGTAADGGPDITGVTATGGPTAEVGATEYSSGDGDDDGDEQSARVKIKFTSDTQVRYLTIKVEVENDDDDDDSNAKIKVSLSKIKGLALAGADIAGPQQWSGVLCNNAAATIDYVLSDTGAISGVVANPVDAEVKVSENKIEVRFATGERVKIKVKSNDGLFTIKVDERIRCDFGDPTVNVSTTLDDDDDDDHGDRHGRGHGGGDDDDDNGSSTSLDSVAPASSDGATTTENTTGDTTGA
jgi:hypothetical protein